MAYQHSLKEINARIARDVHASVELVRGEGYHYLVFDNGVKYEDKSIMVPYTGQLTLKQWIEEARQFAAENDPREERETDYGNTYVEGAATPAHAELAEKLRDRLLAKHNDMTTRLNAERVAAGEEPYKLHEVKKFEVTHFKGGSQTFVTVETGLVDDEGTMASVVCRDYRHIAISKRGGLKLLNAKVKRDSEGFWNVLHKLTR